jgi:hypothetical protein
MLENRSFDHMLGFLYADTGNSSPAGHPFEGLTGTESNTDAHGAEVTVFKIDPAGNNVYFMPGTNPGEGYTATNLQLFGAGPAPVALRAGPGWGQTLLIITYDEHGGCYDHVPPPGGAIPPDRSTGEYGFDFTRFGVRVPAVLVSPLIAPGTVFPGARWGHAPGPHLHPQDGGDAVGAAQPDGPGRRFPRTEDPADYDRYITTRTRQWKASRP